LDILKILEEDARTPVEDMATMLAVDGKTVEDRVRELKKAGVIRKFKASIDWKKMGRSPAKAIIQVKVVPAGEGRVFQNMQRACRRQQGKRCRGCKRRI